MTQTNADRAALRRPVVGNALLHRIRRYPAINIVVLYATIVVVAVACSYIFPQSFGFAAEGNFAVLSQQIPVTAIAAVGVGLLMICGEFDLSIAGTYTLIPFLTALAVGRWGWPLAAACLLSFAVAALIGLVNGLVTTRLAIPSFIATLGMMFLLQGAVRFVSINPATNQPGAIAFFPGDAFDAALTGDIAGPLYSQFIWLLLVAAAAYLILNRHQIGNHFFLAGGDAHAAVAVGVPVRHVKVIAFVLCALCAGLAGLLQATRIHQIEPSATLIGLELKAIAAVVVGGVSLFGGRGTILGMVLGAALIETVDNLLVLLNAPETVFKGFLGATIILAVVLNTMLGRQARRA